MIEQVISDIAAAESDGTELLEKVFKNTLSGKKFCITNLIGLDAVHSTPQNGILFLNTKDAKILMHETPGGKKPGSLTGLMVHELFHAADFHSSMAVVIEKTADEHVLSDTLTHAERCRVLTAFCNIHRELLLKNDPEPISEKLNQKFYTYLIENKTYILQQVAQTAGVPTDSFTMPNFPRLPMAPKPELTPKLNLIMNSKKKFTDKEIQELLTPNNEKDATNYTDVFMTKHFPGEPWRGKYSNWVKSKTEHPLIVLPRGCGEYVPNIYEPATESIENLGTFSQPKITKDLPCKNLLKKTPPNH